MSETPARPGIFGRIKQFIKDSIVGATSTHGGVGGGVAGAGRKSRQEKKRRD